LSAPFAESWRHGPLKSKYNGSPNNRQRKPVAPVPEGYKRMVVHSLPEGWLPVSIAPIDADLEVSVMDNLGVHALIFPVRKSGNSWVDASTKTTIDIQPTHWKKWTHNREDQ
jgi:hypothetical protein